MVVLMMAAAATTTMAKMMMEMIRFLREPQRNERSQDQVECEACLLFFLGVYLERNESRKREKELCCGEPQNGQKNKKQQKPTACFCSLLVSWPLSHTAKRLLCYPNVSSAPPPPPPVQKTEREKPCSVSAVQKIKPPWKVENFRNTKESQRPEAKRTANSRRSVRQDASGRGRKP
jgi:hypothetical protein